MEQLEASVQFNFIVRFKLKRAGLVKRLKEIREVLENSIALAPEYKTFYSVVAVQLRLLLCDNKNSFLYKLNDDPKLPPLRDRFFDLDTSAMRYNKDMFDWETTPIPLDEWVNQDLMFYKRTVDDIPKTIAIDHFEHIKNSIKGANRAVFFSHYSLERLVFEEQELDFYVLNEQLSDEQRNELFNMLNQAGYNNLSLYHLIKLAADKLGAHADEELPTGLILMQSLEKDYRGYFDEIAIMMLRWIDEFIKEEEKEEQK